MGKRERWVDYVKLLACILVAAGHFFMSMVEANILPDTTIYAGFIRLIYYFHVPLFFMCSGYLYQKKSKVKTLSSWKNNILEKAITLGIPYFVFSVATWMLKNVFSGSVNTQNDGLLVTLFVKPASPYWYLYTLFFIFLITPNFGGRRGALVGLLAAVALKYIGMFGFFAADIYAITSTFDNLVWFILGMCLSVFDIPERCNTSIWKGIGILCGGMFLAASVSASSGLLHSATFDLVMGTLGCASVFLIILRWNPGNKLRGFVNLLSRNTMPVYLMHTIFAAGIRVALLKLGICNPAVHVFIGLVASFGGPMLVAWIMEKLKLDFLIYPGKYMKHKSN